MSCGTSDIGMTCLPLSMMNTCMDEKSIYFSIICCRSCLAVNVLWHKWHWNDLSSTLHDEHLYGWKIYIFFNYLLQKLTCSKCVVAQVTLEWLVFHSPWWSLVCMKNPNIFQVLVELTCSKSVVAQVALEWLSSTLYDEHLCAWKTQIFSKYLLQKLTCIKCVVAQVTLEWLVFHSPWWSLVCMKKKPNIFQVLVAKVDLQ